MATNSTRNSQSRKSKIDRPAKPYKDFPLTPHASGAWQKKINGRIFYFGRWAKTVNGKLERFPGDGWKEALQLYKAQADDLHAGRTPRVRSGGLTVAALCNRYLTFKKHRLNSSEITRRTFDEYRQSTDRIVSRFGRDRLVSDLAADDFAALRADMAEHWGPVKLGKEIQAVRSLFKFALDEGLLDRPIRFGQQFNKPSAAVLRKHKAKGGPKLLSAAECRKMIDAADPAMRAMMLLALNCGFGNHDCATLPESVVDLEKGWIDFPRPKTGVERRCPLWAETVQALREAIARRPEPQREEWSGLLFLTVRGRPWLSREIANPVSVACRKLMKSCGVHRELIGFYTLRHVFRTIADGTRDQVAVNYVMGHADPSMAAVYREGVDDARLLAVCEHVRAWLWPTDATTDGGEGQDVSTDDAPATDPVDDAPVTLRLYSAEGGAA
ncbi:MAG: tyrosine-type recombinase/integrase [Planctomycetaceae bacterium]